jgi:integrase
MSVRKRTLPSGEIRWQVDYRDQQGVRRARQFKTQTAAKDFETVARGEIRSGVHVADTASTTIKEAATLWLEQCTLEGLEPATLKQYAEHVSLHIAPLIGKTKLSRLTKPDAVAFRDKLLETRSRAMAKKVMTSLKGLLAKAQEHGLVNQNVAAGTKVKKIDGRHEEKVKIPEKDEIRALLAKANECPIHEIARALVITALFTGLRSSELRGLVWDRVDFENRVIRVEQRADYRGVIGSPKSAASRRTVPMSPMVVNTLRQWRLVCPKTEAGLVFPTENGGVIRHSRMHRIWRSLLDAAGLPRRYRFHDLRHTAASLFIEQGWQPKKIMEIMGHSSIKMTFDLYGHLWATPESDQEAMAQIEARLLR